MFMNLHTLPIGQHMYTVYLTSDPEGTDRSVISAEEADVVYDSRASWAEVVNYGHVHPATPGREERIVDVYGPDCRVLGVVNQSDGYVMYDAFAAGDETGANDL